MTLESESCRNANHREDGRDSLFFQLFMAHQGSLRAFILASVHNYSDANDLLQETATVMWRKFDSFSPGGSFVAWGIGIARNQILNFFRQRKLCRLRFDDELLERVMQVSAARSEGFEERMEALRHCFAQLSVVNQQVLDMRYRLGLNATVVASKISRSVAATYKHIARLQVWLQNCISSTLGQERPLP